MGCEKASLAVGYERSPPIWKLPARWKSKTLSGHTPYPDGDMSPNQIGYYWPRPTIWDRCDIRTQAADAAAALLSGEGPALPPVMPAATGSPKDEASNSQHKQAIETLDRRTEQVGNHEHHHVGDWSVSLSSRTKLSRGLPPVMVN
jgi:hypothetical protein